MFTNYAMEQWTRIEDSFVALCKAWSSLTLLTYPHAEAAATYRLLFFQQLLQKA